MDGIVKDDNKIIGEFIKKCEEIVKTLWKINWMSTILIELLKK
jgi:hypothetical protein